MNKSLWAVLCMLYFLFTLYSCKEENFSEESLLQAQNLIEDNPSEALQLLESILCPEQMNEDDYMQYIVTKVQAKYKLYQNITNDTLIFKACEYFDKENNYKQSALAHFYAASLYHEKEMPYKELESFLLAKYYAELAADNLLGAKSLQCIGNLYNEKHMLASAIVSYKLALEYYAKEDNTGLYKLETKRMLGIVYRTKGDLDNAYLCFNEGLHDAELLSNSDYQVTFTHLLGMVFLQRKDYEKAGRFMEKAFSETRKEEEQRRICLYLLKLYNETGQLDKAGYYAGLLKENLHKITYVYTLQESYGFLSDYYRKTRNFEEVDKYNRLLMDIVRKNAESNNHKQLLDVQQKYETAIQKSEEEKSRLYNRLLILLGISVVVFVVMAAYFRIRQVRLKEQGKNKLLQAEVEKQQIEFEARQEMIKKQQKSLRYIQGIYQNIIDEWLNIDREVQALAKEYGAKTEPELYRKIKELNENLKHNSNQYLISLSRDYLLKQPFGEKAIEILNERELLIFILFFDGYKAKDIAVLLNVLPDKLNMYLRQLNVRNKLIKAGMPAHTANRIMRIEAKDAELVVK